MKNGFKRFNSLDKVEYVDVEPVLDSVPEVETPADKVMNLIFSKDSRGWPQSSVAVMLSPKTSDDVRKFIESNLIAPRDTAHLINEPSIVNEFNNLSSEFVAQASRNRYESIEDYEKRLSDLISEKELSEKFDAFRKKLLDYQQQK